MNIGWEYFCVAFGGMLVISFLMGLLSVNLFTLHVVIRKFNVIDLEFPASALELAALIKGIFLLPADMSRKSLRALKQQLYLDFFLIPFVYGSVFILCIKVSGKLSSFGRDTFQVLAWLQFVALVFDVIENIYLLNKIRPQPAVSKPVAYNTYLVLEVLKWGLSLTGAVCSIAAICYFWLTGRYSYQSIYYLLIIIAEIVVILVAKKITSLSEKEQLKKFEHTAG